MSISATPLLYTDPPPMDFWLQYDQRGPRYTSYPTVPVWQEDWSEPDYHQRIIRWGQTLSPEFPISLYVHLPFCPKRCLFCGCNVVITQKEGPRNDYMDILFSEINQISALLENKPTVFQMQWGGGTPTYLSLEHTRQLHDLLASKVNWTPNAEQSIEIDPRTIDLEKLKLLKELGFNRISLGVQDFEPKVQEAINRIQPIEMTEQATQQCRDLGFSGVNFDLIYGLPYQTPDTFARTIDEVLRLNPDRIALYNFAFVPWLSPHQNKLPQEALPESQAKIELFQMGLKRFQEAGYVYIGMDHFARPHDELTIAQQEGRLKRNFMGYTVQQAKTGIHHDTLLAFGVSAISDLGDFYAQHVKKLSTYERTILKGERPIWRGYALTEDDKIRRYVIMHLLCHGEVNLPALSQQWNIDARSYFAKELEIIAERFPQDVVTWSETGFTLTPWGRLISRNVAMPFDAHLNTTANSPKPVFSKTL